MAQLARSGGDVLTEPQVLAVNRAVAALVGVRDGSQGFDPRAARPLDFTDPADGAAIRSAPGSSAALLGGVLGGLSRQALDLGLFDPMGLVDALARDYEADGQFDGLGSAPLTLEGTLLSPDAGGADLRRGNAEFLGDPLRNRSGSLPADQPTLIDPPAQPTVTLLPPVTFERVSGDVQVGAAGDLLAQRLVAVARDANGVAVPGVSVEFFVSEGEGVALVQSSAFTDGDGEASTLVQLGAQPGAVRVGVTSVEVPGTVVFTATAVAGPPATLSLVTAPTSVGLETNFGVSLQLLDRLGNAAVSSSSATIEVSTTFPQGALSGTTERAPSGGLVTFDDLQLDAPGDGYALQVSFPGLTPVAVSPLSVTPLPLAWRVTERTFQRAGGAAASDSYGTIYLVGGETGDGPLATVHAYYPASDWLTQLETGLSYPRADVAAACVGTRLYVLGGSEELVSLSIVESYAPGPGWRREDPLPESVYGAAAVAGPDGKLYVLGGRQSQEGQGSLPVGYVQVLDTASGLWTKLADLATPRAFAGAAFGPDGRIYVVGGVGDDSPLALVEAYDPATGVTTAVEPMPRARANCAALTGPDGRIYAIGGSDCSSTFGHSAVDVLSTVTGEWTPGASLTDGRTRFQAAVAADGQLVVVGGQWDADVTSIEVYGPQLEVLYVGAGTWMVRGSGFADGAAYEVRADGPEGELLLSGVTSEGGFARLIQLPNGSLWARDAKSLYPVTCRPPG